jgi:hypothetical protein
MVKVKSLKMHSYAGKLRPPGSVYDINPRHRRIYERIGRVEAHVPSPPEPEVNLAAFGVEANEPPRPRKSTRRYKRRDMEAEDGE